MRRLLLSGLLFLATSLAAEPLTLLDAGGTILRFIDTTAPSVSIRTVTVTGLQPNEVLAAIDYRPVNGALYGVGALPTGQARLYTINTTTGVATLVGNGAFHEFIGLAPIGMDFNPIVDRIRLITNAFNLRVNPNDASVVADTDVRFATGDPNQNNGNSPRSIAYLNNPAATSTTLYAIVSGNGPLLVTIGSPGGSPVSPNTGLMFTVGSTGTGGYSSARQSMDISIRTGIAYVVMDNDNKLYTVNLSTGKATSIGSFPTGSAIFGLSASGDRSRQKRRGVHH